MVGDNGVDDARDDSILRCSGVLNGPGDCDWNAASDSKVFSGRGVLMVTSSPMAIC